MAPKRQQSSSSDDDSSSSEDESTVTATTESSATTGTSGATTTTTATSGSSGSSSGTGTTTTSSGTSSATTGTTTSTSASNRSQNKMVTFAAQPDIAGRPPVAVAMASSPPRQPSGSLAAQPAAPPVAASASDDDSTGTSSDDSSDSSTDDDDNSSDDDSTDDEESTTTEATTEASSVPPAQPQPAARLPQHTTQPVVHQISQQQYSSTGPVVVAVPPPRAPSSSSSGSSDSEDSDSDATTTTTSNTTSTTTTTTSTTTTSTTTAATTTASTTTAGTSADEKPVQKIAAAPAGGVRPAPVVVPELTLPTQPQQPQYLAGPPPLQYPQQTQQFSGPLAPPPLIVTVPPPQAGSMRPPRDDSEPSQAQPSSQATGQPAPQSQFQQQLPHHTSAPPATQKPLAPNRYGDGASVSSTSTSSEADEAGKESPSETSTESDETSSTISDADARAAPKPAVPTRVVRTVRSREKKTLDVSNATPPTDGGDTTLLPAQLFVATGSFADSIGALCLSLEQRERNAEVAAAASATLPPLPSPPQHTLSRASALVAGRCVGLSDMQCAKMLFGAEERVTNNFLSAKLYAEADRMIIDRVVQRFRAEDTYHEGELSRSAVCRLLCQLGFGSCKVANDLVDVQLHHRGAGSLEIRVSYTVPESDPPQTRSITVEANPRNFQMFTDQTRGEVTCNGVSVCTHVMQPAKLMEVVQAIQCCVYIANCVDVNTVEEDGIVAYEQLLKSLLADKPPEMLGAAAGSETAAVPAPPQRSLLHEQLIGSLLKPTAMLEEAASTSRIEPFLLRAAEASAAERAKSVLPTTSMLLPQLSATNPAVEGESVSVFDLQFTEVHVPLVVPQNASRYLIVSVMTNDAADSVRQAVRVFAKPFKPDAKASDRMIWEFSKKKVRNRVILSGSPQDTLYVEVCYEVPSTATTTVGLSKRRSVVTSCAGFATSSLDNLRSGTVAVKPGSYFRRAAPSEGKDEAVDSNSAGCFCFTSKPATRITFQCEPIAAKTLAEKGWMPIFSLASSPAVEFSPMSSASRPASRVVALERHIDIILCIRAMLLRAVAKWSGGPKGLRSQVTQAAITIVGSANQAALDLLSRCWEVQPKQILSDSIQADKVLSSLLLRVYALTTTTALSNCFDGSVSVEELPELSIEAAEGLKDEILLMKKLPTSVLYPRATPTNI